MNRTTRSIHKKQLFDDDIARIKADVLLNKADLLTEMSEHEACTCGRSVNHQPDCAKEIFVRIARMLRMDAEG